MMLGFFFFFLPLGWIIVIPYSLDVPVGAETSKIQ